MTGYRLPDHVLQMYEVSPKYLSFSPLTGRTPATDPLPETSGLEVITHDYSLRLKIKRNDWLLADTCPQAAKHCTLF